jgi:hypothetical protein
MVLQRWEYLVVALHRSLNMSNPEAAARELLDSVGAEGWELVAVDDLNAYFRRPKE